MATEERIDFRSIMNILVHVCHDDNHPTLNNNVFKGEDFKIQANLYKHIQVVNPESNFLGKIAAIGNTLVRLEKDITI
jgi:hypothetical protein